MATIAWLLILYCCGVMSYLIIEFGWSYAIVATYATLTLLSLWAHLATMLSNPGAVPRAARPLASAREAGIPETICGRCDAYKPPRSHHCSVCDACVQVMDHHCVFIDNCVGAGNQKFFVRFVLTIGFATAYAAAHALYYELNRYAAGRLDIFRLAKELQAVERARFAEAKLASAAEGKPLKEIVKARKLARLPALRALRLIRQSQDIKMIMLMVLLTGVSLGVFVLFCNQAVQLKNGETQLEKFDREGRAGADWRSFPGWRGVLRMEHGPRTGGPKRPADTHNHAD